MRLTEHAVLPGSPQEVWRVLADWERYPRWMPDVAWVRPLGSQRGVGMQLAVRTRVFGVPAVTDRFLVTAWDEPRRIAIEHRGLVRGPAEWLLEPGAEGTRFTWRESIRMPPPLLGDLALAIYRPLLLRTFRASIRNLGALLETSG